MWSNLLKRHGFTCINATVLPAPTPGKLGTLLVSAHPVGSPLPTAPPPVRRGTGFAPTPGAPAREPKARYANLLPTATA
ncbi:hypothetical protein ACFPH6_33115 [Streptomyces xiangluensis]|uniref:Uncharacterized protein n=1 Tax=Streptomyces xiangluensis TaxID=2665720 RepID=A0ABV8YYA4_9ACTN